MGRLKKKKPTIKANPEQIESLRKSMDEMVKVMPEMARLYDRLLSIDGFAVARSPEEDIEKLLTRGIARQWGAKMVPGERNDCHGNAARLWAKDREGAVIETGWAMSEDGVWRQHSWARKGPTILETTTPRLLYYGFELTPKEAERFYMANR